MIVHRKVARRERKISRLAWNHSPLFSEIPLLKGGREMRDERKEVRGRGEEGRGGERGGRDRVRWDGEKGEGRRERGKEKEEVLLSTSCQNL